MRHRKKRHHLSKPADQRKALLRSLASSFIKYEEIVTTLPRAKAVKEQVEGLITLAKRGDVHAMRQALRWIYNYQTGETFTTDKGKILPVTVLRKLFGSIGPRCAQRAGGYTRIIKAPPRRGDAAPMAMIQLVSD